jgi:hypothetical protein
MKPNLKPIICCWLALTSLSAFAQHLSFDHYKLSIYSGRPAKLKTKGNPLAEQFRTIIKDTYYSKEYIKTWHGATGLNFAGHYCFVFWGCGSPCKASAIVDLKTGIVYTGVTAAFDYKFRRNSRLVIVDADTETNSTAYKTEYWLWNEDKKRFDKLK